MGQKLVSVPECHSTNTLLAELLQRHELPEGTAVVTPHQTAGRGQRGNTWTSQPGKNLTVSFLLFPTFAEAARAFEITQMASLAVLDTVSAYVPGARVKWPNDILVGARKMAGILIENQVQGAFLSQAIVGIGLNVNQTDFALPTATSLAREINQAVALQTLWEELAANLERRYIGWRERKSRLDQAYLAQLYWRGEWHTFQTREGKMEGMIEGVDSHGRLCVRTAQGVRFFSLQEIQYLA
ncbi:MAG: biotin--[acetyl-CoA-carboxylase] ligase [Cyclobacteriaceae bacterium]|nr:biotin--[acetyl-CoA-carboxylase] ligase [Cyclobacteriaceae bacterium]